MDFKTYLLEAKADKPAKKQPTKRVAVVSGRYNPPTRGHVHLFNKADQVARDSGAELHIVASHSEGTSKNPLPQDKKLDYLKKVVPQGAQVYGTSKQEPTIFHTLAKLHSQGFTHVTMVSDGPRTEEYKKTIPKYNGVEGRHGLYNFKKIDFVSAGERNPDDEESIEGVSATKAREHALAGEHDKFKSMLPIELHPHAQEMANHIKLANESTEEMFYKKTDKKIPMLFQDYALYEQASKQLNFHGVETKNLDQCPSAYEKFKPMIEKMQKGELIDTMLGTEPTSSVGIAPSHTNRSTKLQKFAHYTGL